MGCGRPRYVPIGVGFFCVPAKIVGTDGTYQRLWGRGDHVQKLGLGLDPPTSHTQELKPQAMDATDEKY